MISIQHYARPTRYSVSSLAFRSEGVEYTGRGVLSWRSEEGFHLEAALERDGPPMRTFTLRAGTRWVKDTPVQLRFSGLRAKAWVTLDEFELVHGRWLSVDFPELQTLQRGGDSLGDWTGSALMSAGRLILPGPLERNRAASGTRIDDDVSSESLIRQAPDMDMRAFLEQPGELHLKWALTPAHWTRKQSMRWPEAFATALGMTCGYHLPVDYMVNNFPTFRLTSVSKKRDAESLWPLSPLGAQQLIDSQTAEQCVNIARFLARGGQTAEICRRIFYQLLEAARQETTEGQALLTGTILEAALRTLDGRPYEKRVRGQSYQPWWVRDSLGGFCAQFLNEHEPDVANRVYDVWDAVRNRHAHPDWLISVGGALSYEALNSITRELQTLARFYGAMILALAGLPVRADLLP